MNHPDQARADQGSFWAWVPALLLGSMLSGLGVMAYLAIDDPHFALEPNYYDKALHWDSRQAEARESRELGLRLVLGPLRTRANGSMGVELRVAEPGQQALAGAHVELEAFPNAYASRVERVSLRETSPGVYIGELRRGLPGLWELRVVVRSNASSYRQVFRADARKGDSA